MDTHELLVRTLNAAKETRENGYEQTADAFDIIVENLLKHINSQVQSVGEKRANSIAYVQHFH